MSKAFGDDFITITDEDGVEYELEVLASIEYNGFVYIAVCEADHGDDTQPEVNVLKVVEEDGEEILEAVRDDDELSAVFDLLMFDYETDDESDEEE